MPKRTDRLESPACWRCDKNYYYDGAVSRYQHGVLMHPGDHLCLGGKRARKFRARDPKRKPPSWCPKRKTPCELRVYGFISEDERRMHSFFSGFHDDEYMPSESRYGVRFEGTTGWTPRQFWDVCNEYGADLKLPVTIGVYEIVEIDDGSSPRSSTAPINASVCCAILIRRVCASALVRRERRRRMPKNCEKIRYHDNMTGPEYGPDGMLSDNWDPDADYDASEYVDAHFRVDTPAYRPPSYHFEEKDERRFNEEAAGVFARLGWTAESEAHGGECVTVRKGKSDLYLHPQDFSGTVLKSEVRTIAEALRQHETFSLLRVDLYETICDITDEAYYAYLDTQAGRIRDEVLKASVTTRRSKFYRDYDIANHVAGKVRLNRIGDDDGKHFGTGKTARYIIGVIDRLVEQGELASAQSRNGSRMIRTLNKTERRARKNKAA